MEASTATGNGAESSPEVGKFAEFYIGEQWSAKQLFFTGTAQGETMVKRFPSAVGASKIRLSIDNDDAWGFWRIKFGGVTIHEYSGADAGRPPLEAKLNGVGFWIDENVGGTEAPLAPSSIEINIPSTFWIEPCDTP